MAQRGAEIEFMIVIMVLSVQIGDGVWLHALRYDA